MKKLLSLFLLAPFFLNGQNIIETNFESLNYNFILQNGNTLNIASVNLDTTTAESQCQCTEYQFGTRLWVFETDQNLEIINQRCFSQEEFSGQLGGWWDDECPDIYDVFYEDNDIVFHIWEGSNGYNYTGQTGFSSGITSGSLVKFDLEEFNFYDPVPYNVGNITGSGMFMVIDKTFKILAGTTETEEYYMNLHYRAENPPPSNWDSQDALISRDGYQNLYIQDLEGNNQYLGESLSEIFAGNSVEVILDYKQNSPSIISFLVAANSLDGLYSEGIQYETSLFIIEIDFSDFNNVQYDVVKSELEIPRDIDLRYEDYNVFIDNNNNFVFNIRQQQQQDFLDTIEEYNELHFLNDDGSYNSINIDNDWSVTWDTSAATAPTPSDWEFFINHLNFHDSHYLLDIAFNEDHFMTLAEVKLRRLDPDQGMDEYSSPLQIFSVIDYSGYILQRYVLSREELILVPEFDMTTFYTQLESYWYDTFDFISGVDNFGSGYLVNNFPNSANCVSVDMTTLHFGNMLFDDPSMTASVEVIGADATFTVAASNFVIGDGSGDGHWNYSLNDGETEIFYTSELILTDLPNGDHSILIWLVDNNNQPLNPVVEQTIEFSTYNPAGDNPGCSDFESGTSGWTVVDAAGNESNWTLDETTQGGANESTYSMGHGYTPISTAYNDWLVSPAYNTTGLSAPTLSYWEHLNWSPDAGEHNVYYSTDYAGDATTATWVLLNDVIGTDAEDTWVQRTFALPSAENVVVSFQYNSTYGADWNIDDVCVQEDTLSTVDSSVLDMRIYPNPSSEMIYIKSNVSSNYHIYNMIGQKITSGQINEGTNELNLRQYNIGVYFIKFIKNNRVYTKKIIKN